MEVLAAILGEDVLEKMSKEQVKRLAKELDAEILKDADLTSRLAKVVHEATTRLEKNADY